MRVLVGDIGGTKTRLAVAETAGDGVELALERYYPSGDFASLEDILAAYLAETRVTCAVGGFAVAGPVQDDRSRITNLPWVVDARRLERSLGLTAARLLNDLEAVAWGIAALGAADLAVLHSGEGGTKGNACVVAAGTGLGEAGLYWDGRCHHPFATEGGHADFAPDDEREVELWRFLRRCYGRVSWERVVSGMGIGDIFRFLLAWRGGEAPPEVAAVLAADPAAVIAMAAAAGTCPLCIETMELFARLYGREAGNMGLKHLALGGVYLGGGIAPKNLDLLSRPCFVDAFLAKGRMEPLMRRMPVRVILEQRVPLFGAARFMAAA